MINKVAKLINIEANLGSIVINPIKNRRIITITTQSKHFETFVTLDG
jgi:hypothetical protein